MEASATEPSAAAAAAARRRQQRRVPNEKRKRAANASVSLHGRVPFGSLKADMEIHADVLPARRGKASAYVPSSAAANAVV